MKRRSSRRFPSKSPTLAGPDDDFLRIARARFKAVQDAEREQRQRELDDLRFYAGDQWEQEVLDARKGIAATGILPGAPSRPCLTINKSREPVRQVLNFQRQNNIGITIVPADDFEGLSEPTDQQEIDLREGLIRRIQRTSDAAAARIWAFERATICGRGYYGVMVRFGEGKTWEKEIYVERYYNQNAVTLGPHNEPDGSDAGFGFVGTPIPWEEYEIEYPFALDGKTTNPVLKRGSSEDDFKSLGEDYPDWFVLEGTGKNRRRLCLVVRYWYTEYTQRKLALLPDGSSVWLEDVPEGVKPIDVRTEPVKTIKCAKIDGAQILEQTDWDGHYVPIVKVLGEELQPYDNQQRSEGMVRPGRDAGIASNILISKLVEQIGNTPIPPLILDPESIEGWEDLYKLSSTRAFPWLPQRSRGDDGREFREAHRPAVDPNLQPLALAIGMFGEFFQSLVGVHDPSVGKVDPRLKSGSAIKAVVAQDAHGTSNYGDNLTRSVHHEGRIENDLLYAIYGKPGRIAKIVNPQGESDPIIVNQPFTMQNGKPQPVMMPHPDDPTQQIPAPAGHPMVPPDAKHYTLTKDAKFNVAVKVTKNSDLSRDQLSAFLGELIGQNPQLMAVYGDILFKAIDVPDHEELSERAKVMLAPPVQQALAAKEKGLQIPPALQAHLGQVQQQLQELEKIAAQQQHEIDTEKVKYESQTRIEQMKLDYQAKKTQAENETKIAVAELGAKVDRLALFMEERARLGVQTHEAGLAAADAGHESDMSQQEHGQQLEQNAHQVAGDAALAEQTHGHALEQGAQEAALQPPAAPAGARA